jgi:hypothetical protein
MTLQGWWGLQFIGLNGGGREFQWGRAAVGGGRRVLAQWIRGQRRGNYSGEPRRVAKVHGDTVETLGYVEQGRKTAVHRRPYLLKPQSRGEYGGESPEWRPAHGFYLAVLSGHWWRESQRRRRESRRRSVVGGEGLLRWRFDLHQALYHGEGHQTTWQPSFRVDFLSDFYGNMSKSLQQYCTAVNQLQLCYIGFLQKTTGSCLELSLKFMPSFCQSKFQT